MSAGSPSVPDESFTVLVVCTGNICRSPLAERLVMAWLARTGHLFMRVGSAGTRAVVGSEMHPESAEVLRRLGGDPTGFCARQLSPTDVDAAALVLTMSRDHRREVLGMAPRALSRTFTLLEAADLAGLVGDEVLPAGKGAAERARAVVRAMAASRSRHRSGPEDDVPDPIAGPPSGHDHAGRTIASALGPLFERLLGAPGKERVGQPGLES